MTILEVLKAPHPLLKKKGLRVGSSITIAVQETNDKGITSIQKEIPNNILELYQLNLYRKNEVSVFEKNEVRQNGIIQKVDENGYIWIDLENEGLQKFFHKEIELLY